MQVAEGIFLVQLPLPFALRSVNCYLLRDGAQWTVIDTGLHHTPGQEMWQTTFDELGIEPSSIGRIILTHAHPDHYGMAGWLAQQSGAPVLLSAVEQRFAEQVWHQGEPFYRATQAFFQEHGMPEPLCQVVYENMVALQPNTLPHPAVVTLLAPNSHLTIGGREFVAIETPGHSDGHLAFYCAAERLMLCGDTVLTKITPNISLWPHSHPNPLAAFLQTLELLRQFDVALALPGHGPLITNWHTRLDELNLHHEQRLNAAVAALGEGATGFEVCERLFRLDKLSSHELRFAMAEALAHLEYLVSVGRVVREDRSPRLYRPA
jgi:glyoxylase-like metal-dependent hydrolase (beta-lactamase superfamily II)